METAKRTRFRRSFWYEDVLGLAAVVVVVVVVGCWLLVVGCWLFVVCCLLFVVVCHCLSFFVVCRLLFLLIYEDIHWLYTQVSPLQKTRHTSRWGFVRGYRKWPNIVCKQKVETTIPNQYVDWAWLGIYACPHQKKTNNVFSCNSRTLSGCFSQQVPAVRMACHTASMQVAQIEGYWKRGKVFSSCRAEKTDKMGVVLGDLVTSRFVQLRGRPGFGQWNSPEGLIDTTEANEWRSSFPVALGFSWLTGSHNTSCSTWNANSKFSGGEHVKLQGCAQFGRVWTGVEVPLPIG